ncbi:MAG: 1-deoxy-D-xylulose-5-phosphate synthase [Prevotella sp.]|uniref:1-deoxy-D-xylulose-5-phosphate synthase n=1 Tax=Hallella faecis TaxID=2841596 RepID=A0ABV1FR39_9BACT|nr:MULTISPECIES: 1-deoxy-D-xylulose-5-phosphate synthase [Hallella]MBS7400807.1 1-deoxy-D-xylulose-5-phosphate synthase [Prevotella sp.]MBU0290008.1 1-deoxy-D-xylulose-5-phosphate synthase [Hallella faecis]MCI7433490.1 1-deoxy-D-xylulose-5-phosphate synthase [Prevotella sp.]MDD7145158.1 1-deoxy-D-xylulose-5-phosphate synthase [Hallella sp.]MDY5924345.1 1-deoxy-D-xylulose-5-phosphate synthase [Hallella sp.]
MYIEKILSPVDLKGLDLKALQVVADETRRAVLNRVSKHGGHVGPNLGFVEATVALHYVFNAPKDKLVFDVSHQSYPHKVLTGRASGFLGDVDDMNAISGYSSPAECPEYDNFEVGHTSTSISLATGLQKARDVKGTDENIIAIIGDGSLSGGEAFEGLSEASELGTGIIIVVNDNEMSIAENHGGIYKNLRALRESGGTCEHNWFKAWGFEYKYLEEGNNIEKLIEVFRSVKDTDKPTVVHIHTEKGHGYAPAVKNKEAWHWGLPFNLEDGSRPVRNADGTMPEVVACEDYAELFSDWMLREMKHDKTLIAVTAGTPTAAGFTPDKRKEAGKQHIDMGIAEEQAVAMISGMAKGGLHPVWTVYSTFVQRTYDQIAQDLCINANPAVINVVGGGVNSMNDITHICLFDIPMLCSIPGLIYLAPTTCEEYFAMMRWAIQQDQKPIAIRTPSNGVVHTAEPVDAEYGYAPKYKVMHRGSKVAIIAAGSFYQKGENVVRLLADKGIDATLINPRYLNAVDVDVLNALKDDHQLVVTLEDGCKDGGFGERIASYYGTSQMKVLVGGIKKGLYDRYDVHELLANNRLLDEQIVEDVLGIVD